MAKLEIPVPDPEDGSEEVANDAMQLLAISMFNGVCRVIAALGANGLLTPDQLDNIHDAMTTPLDDPDWRDYGFIADTRNTIELVLSAAVKRSRDFWDGSEDSE